MVPRPFILPCVFVFLILPAVSGSEDQDAEGFTSLFNGRDLSAWVRENCAEDTFTVRDGLIIDTGLPMGVMRSARMYENFILEFDWQHMVSGGNSGCFAWSDGLPHVGGPFPRGIEVQVLDPGFAATHKGENEWYTCQGDLFPVQGATMTPFGRISKNGARSFPMEDRTKPSPEWNHYHLVADRGELRLSINGKEVTVGKDCVPRRGYLSLEAEGAETHFKNLRIKELPSSNTPPEQSARAYEGFHPLFTGKDFGGWKFNEAMSAVWSTRGSHFVTKAGVPANADSHLFDLRSETSYRDFELCVDWRLAGKADAKAQPAPEKDGGEARSRPGEVTDQGLPGVGDSGIWLRGIPNCRVNIGSESKGSGDILQLDAEKNLLAELQRAMLAKVKADAPAGKWNRFFITLQGDRVTVVLNDQTVVDHAQVPGIPAEGPIGLQYRGEEVEFANVFIREL